MGSRGSLQQKVNAWGGGIIGDCLVGSVCLETNLNVGRYLDVLRFKLVPALVMPFPDEATPDAHHPRIWFQQDGAPPYFGPHV